MSLRHRHLGTLAALVTMPGPLVAQAAVLEGVVTIVWADPPGGPAPPPQYMLHTDDADYQLRWSGGSPTSPLAPGDRVRVSGTLRPRAVPRARREGEITVNTVRDLGGASLRADPAVLRYLTVTCQASGGATPLYSPSEAAARFGTGFPAAGHFLEELSEGQLDFRSAGGVGPVTIDPASSYGSYPSVATSQIARDCATGVSSQELEGIDGINFVLNFQPGAAFGGTVTLPVGGGTRVFRATWIPQQQSSFPTLAHEVGHSIGWSHSGMDYGGVSEHQYSSFFDVMSSALLARSGETDFGSQYIQAQTIAVNRAAAGWVPGDRWEVVEPGVETELTLEIIGSGRLGARPPDTRDLVEIRTPGGERYTIEARFKRGKYDLTLFRGGVILHRLTRPIALGFGCCLAKLVDADLNGIAGDDGVVWNVGEEFRDGARGFGFTVLDSLPDGYAVRVRSGFLREAKVVGPGRITGWPGGDCLAECRSLADGGAAPLTLTAEPSQGGLPFRRWLGDCQGTGACVVPADRDRAITAWFGSGIAFLTDSQLPHGTVGQAFSTSLEVDALGTPTITLASGTLPPGLLLDSGAGMIRGTPSIAGTYRFTLRGTDPFATTTQAFSMRVTPPLTPGVGDTVAIVRFDIVTVPIVAGSGEPVELRLVSGAWPNGLAPNGFGALVGNPHGPSRVSATFDEVHASGPVRRTLHFRLLDAPPEIDLGVPIGNLFVGMPIDRTMRSVGPDTVRWSILAGALPPGIALTANGRLHGTPTGGGEYRYTLEARIASLADTHEFIVVVGVPAPTREEVSGALLRGTSLTEPERLYLDFIGNRNGRLDLGDVRAWMLSRGLIPGGGGP